jgi:hypothetical protein
MKQIVVRYKIKPEKVAENTRLVEGLFRELEARKPAGLRYLALQLDDTTIVHITFVEDGALSVSELDAFKDYQGALSERYSEEPLVCNASLIGEYRMLAAAPG